MWYLISKTALFILIAGLIGLWLGWYLGKLARDPEVDQLHNRLRAHRKAEAAETARAVQAEQRAVGLSGELAEREATDRELAERLERLEQQAGVCAANLKDCQAARRALEAEAARLQDELGQRATGGGGSSAPADWPAADGDPDDLQRIKGVGPRIATLLNELGIYQYRQLAALTPEAIADIDAKLRFRGRIERERWVEQARALLAER
ncbi:MAG: hypothetical protein P8106_03120 [Gammaproteobacteria bacterium]